MFARLRFAPRFKQIFQRICYGSAMCSTVYLSYNYSQSNVSFKFKRPSFASFSEQRRFTALCSSKDKDIDTYLDELADGEIESHFQLQDSIRSVKKRVSANKMLDIFKAMYHGGSEITKDFLREMFYTAGVQDKRVADHLFDMMDRNKDGVLQPSEIMAVLTMFQGGTPTSRFKFLFRCLDLDGGGTVDKAEFRATLTAILEAQYHLGGLNDLFDHDEIFSNVYPNEYHTVAKFKSNRIVRDIFLIADSNRDGELSLKEFLHWCRRGSREVRLLENALLTAVDTVV